MNVFNLLQNQHLNAVGEATEIWSNYIDGEEV